MYIHSKPIAAFYKLGIGMVALFSEWFMLSQFGWNALRLFPTWILFIAAIYYLSSALYLAVSHQRETGRNLCPMLEGLLILNFLAMSVVTLASNRWGFYLPELPLWLVWVTCPIMSVATLLDWLLFVKKGRWKIMAPFYWIALPFAYAGTMMFTAELLPEHTLFRYPLEALNYYNFGLFEMLQAFIAFFSLSLIAGYIIYVLDFAMSGKLAKNIVLPHIRVIETDDTETEFSVPATKAKINETAETNERDHDKVDIFVKDSPSEPKDKPTKPTNTTTKPKIKLEKPVEFSFDDEDGSENAQVDEMENPAKAATPTDEPKSAKNFHRSEAQKADKIEVIRVKMNGNKYQPKKTNRKRRSADYNKNRNNPNSQVNNGRQNNIDIQVKASRSKTAKTTPKVEQPEKLKTSNSKPNNSNSRPKISRFNNPNASANNSRPDLDNSDKQMPKSRLSNMRPKNPQNDPNPSNDDDDSD